MKTFLTLTNEWVSMCVCVCVWWAGQFSICGLCSETTINQTIITEVLIEKAFDRARLPADFEVVHVRYLRWPPAAAWVWAHPWSLPRCSRSACRTSVGGSCTTPWTSVQETQRDTSCEHPEPECFLSFFMIINHFELRIKENGIQWAGREARELLW